LGIEPQSLTQERELSLKKQEQVQQKETPQKENLLEVKETQSTKSGPSLTKEIVKDVSKAFTELATPENQNESLNAELRNEEEQRRRRRNRELER
jgi:hypothetical protein